ncbi:MAG: ThiF family adenylyltransferase, partial [Pseudomonadota bacterium]
MEPATSDSPKENWMESFEAYLTKTYGAKRLEGSALKRFRKRAVTIGWALTSPNKNELLLLAGPGFPYELPKVAWPDTSKVLVWPHIENDGVICAVPTTTTVDSAQPAKVVDELLIDSDRIISEGMAGTNLDDFKTEFLAYWGIAADDELVVSTCDAVGNCRELPVWKRRRGSKSLWIIGETEHQLKTWLQRTCRVKRGDTVNLQSGLLLPLLEPLLPSEYPKNTAQLRDIAHSSGHGVAFDDVLKRSGKNPTPIIIATPSASGLVLAAVVVSKLAKKEVARAFNKKGATTQQKESVLFSEERGVTLHTVKRRDAVWVHGRGLVPAVVKRQTQKVSIIGCGSLGSSVAQHLADAGVGSFVFVDGDNLSAENTSRHVLGGQFLGANKAHALALHIQARHPHVRDVSYVKQMVKASNEKLLRRIFSADLVINCSGEWPVMSLLDDIHATGTYSTALQTAWFEPHAIASVSLVSRRGGRRVSDGFEADGYQWS